MVRRPYGTAARSHVACIMARRCASLEHCLDLHLHFPLRARWNVIAPGRGCPVPVGGLRRCLVAEFQLAVPIDRQYECRYTEQHGLELLARAVRFGLRILGSALRA